LVIVSSRRAAESHAESHAASHAPTATAMETRGALELGPDIPEAASLARGPFAYRKFHVASMALLISRSPSSVGPIWISWSQAMLHVFVTASRPNACPAFARPAGRCVHWSRMLSPWCMRRWLSAGSSTRARTRRGTPWAPLRSLPFGNLALVDKCAGSVTYDA